MEEISDIAEFYRGKSVFVTGGTGFVGKVLVEKLLYSCPDIDKIFILIRDQNGVDFEKRFKSLYEGPLFQKLKIERPDCFNKVVPVRGDLSADNLIANIQDINTLIEEVSVVFHVAATIKFNAPLDFAMTINVEGAKKVLELSRQMKKLNAVVHVSTAFAYPMTNVMEEKLYPFPIKKEELYAKLTDKKLTAKQEEEILAGWPNTYIFTKSLMESIIAEDYKDLPLVIVRPSIVTASEGGPLPGWVDNWTGATGILYALSTGYDRVLFGRPEYGTNLIPVDYVSNCIIIAATTANRDSFGIYNICTTPSNKLTLDTLTSESIDNFVKNEYSDLAKQNKSQIRTPTKVHRGRNNTRVLIDGFTADGIRDDFPWPYFTFTQSLFVETVIHTIIWILSLLGDLGLKVSNKRTRFVRSHSKLVSAHDILRFFTNKNWIMKCDATRSLYQTLSPVDRKVFFCDTTMINWKSYIATYCAGMQAYLVKKTKKHST